MGVTYSAISRKKKNKTFKCNYVWQKSDPQRCSLRNSTHPEVIQQDGYTQRTNQGKYFS